MENHNQSLQELIELRAFLDHMNAYINDEKHYQMLIHDIAAVEALIALRTVEVRV